MPVTVSKSGPGFAKVAQRLRKLKSSEVLVGIPADRAQREGETINNAGLLFIHTHGSELQNIPARPVLEPAIENNRALISTHLGEAARQMTAGFPDKAERELARAGTIGANAAKRFFTEENGWPPNAPSTIKRKGSDRPLIDTGALRRSITHIVRVDK